MAIAQFQASAQLLAGTAVRVQSRQFEVILDEPPALGGKDGGMTPIEALLGSLGACQIIVAKLYAKRFDVVLDDFRVEVEGGLDLDGLLDRAPVRSGCHAIRYHFHITTPSPRHRVDELVIFLQAHCPVGDSLAQNVELSLAGVTIHPSAQQVVPEPLQGCA